ncbi:hypothetical protein H5410_056463 [Solanum commersonii]|uniref:Uncharacterized protein n=1 Tax=Solanum commersonii TaxID=4109 RepID=A0A9J5WKB1_SOLCO|nr:hypothetical protein H5410_056463 [Solanum commersonii]
MLFFLNFSWTSIKTVTMELVGPDWKSDLFSKSNDPRSFPWIFWRSGFSMSFLPKLFVDIRKDLSYGQDSSQWENRSNFKSNEPRRGKTPCFSDYRVL